MASFTKGLIEDRTPASPAKPKHPGPKAVEAQTSAAAAKAKGKGSGKGKGTDPKAKGKASPPSKAGALSIVEILKKPHEQRTNAERKMLSCPNLINNGVCTASKCQYDHDEARAADIRRKRAAKGITTPATPAPTQKQAPKPKPPSSKPEGKAPTTKAEQPKGKSKAPAQPKVGATMAAVLGLTGGGGRLRQDQ